VGTASLGEGLWGQLDLAGEVWEWNLDWAGPPYHTACTDCADLADSPPFLALRVIRGGGSLDAVSALLPPTGGNTNSTTRVFDIGFRCSRTPPVPCPAGQRYQNGICAPCPSGMTACGSVCIDEQTDPNFCGACENVCPGGGECAAGICTCSAGDAVCSNICVNEETDPNNCGGCGVVCQATAPCLNGACVPCDEDGGRPGCP